MNKALVVNNLVKSYKSLKAVDNVSFTAYEGEILGLLGVNGAGKTTIIKVLTGLVKKDAGDVNVLGYDLEKNITDIKGLINVSPQETSVAPNLTVKENLLFFKAIYGLDDEAYFQSLIAAFKLEEVLNKRAKKLSGGYARRLSIAISLINKPSILFLDEPTLGLDVLARRNLWSIIKKLKGSMTIILTSHYLEEIESICDHALILSKGKTKAYGTIDALLEETKTSSLEEAFVKLVELDGE